MEREAMYHCLRKFAPNFDVLDSQNGFIVILTSHEKEVLHSFGHFAFNGFKKRMMIDWASIFLIMRITECYNWYEFYHGFIVYTR